ncbi:uncharacterized protein LOC117813238 isoform X3 [Xyrichtys novacula]|uniref:Uncharacterized protein LOC117813238 isoform X3 n=1 Tax=Xyrichtys novacula TaxID=13765 RepID=A0AAV1FR67_XYRNO|nr:uncharacterized protein LOC117813238 isoform X3 [Xyrichtys novacula]
MGPHKCRAKLDRERGFSGNKDTPVKPALDRRDKFRKLLPTRHHETIQEEPELDEIKVPTVRPTDPVLKNRKSVYSKSVSHSSSPALTSKGNTFPSATPATPKSGRIVSPAGHPMIQMTPNPMALKSAAKPAQKRSSATPESVQSSMESNTTFSSDDDDDEEDCYSSEASSSSSLPSPEIFRRDSSEDSPGHRSRIKNSTLLDVSHAETIHMYHPPNLSTIIDASSILYEKKCENNQPLGPEAETKQKRVTFEPEKACISKRPTKPAKRRSISHKKKVCFKSPFVFKLSEAKPTSANKVTPHITTKPVGRASPTEQNKPETDPHEAGEGGVKEDESQTVKFFDFDTDSDRDAFFQMMRERSVRLRNAPLFPLTAVKPTNSLIM